VPAGKKLVFPLHHHREGGSMKRAGLAAALALAIGCGTGVTRDGVDRPGDAATVTAERTGENSGAAQAGSSENLSLTGCVRADAVAGDASGAGATSAAVSGGTYMLTNARLATAVASTAGTSGSSANGSGAAGNGAAVTGGRAAGSGGDTYVLEGENIEEHVGQEVQITGKLVSSQPAAETAGSGANGSAAAASQNGSAGGRDSAGRSPAAGAGTGASGSAGGAATGVGSMRLQVASVRKISDRCFIQ
jgi:hypothetical protein